MRNAVITAVNNYIGAVGLFNSVGVKPDSLIIYNVHEIFQSLIEYQIDSSHDVNRVYECFTQSLRQAKAEGRIFDFKSEWLEHYEGWISTVDFVRGSVLTTEFRQRYRLTAEWDRYLEDLYFRNNVPVYTGQNAGNRVASLHG